MVTEKPGRYPSDSIDIEPIFTMTTQQDIRESIDMKNIQSMKSRNARR